MGIWERKEARKEKSEAQLKVLQIHSCLGKKNGEERKDGLIYGDDGGAHNLKLFMGLELGFPGLGWTRRRRQKLSS